MSARKFDKLTTELSAEVHFIAKQFPDTFYEGISTHITAPPVQTFHVSYFFYFFNFFCVSVFEMVLKYIETPKKRFSIIA